MRDNNSWTGTGTLVADPEVKFLPDGTPCATVRLACNRADKKVGDTWEKQPADFFNLVFWKYQATKAGTLKKGNRIAVTEGRLRQRSWETPEGQKRSAIEIIVDDFVVAAFINTKTDVPADTIPDQPAPAYEDIPQADDTDDVPF